MTIQRNTKNSKRQYTKRQSFKSHTNINNYNNFLLELDKKQLTNNNESNNNSSKKAIEQTLKNISDSFINSNLKNPNFTGISSWESLASMKKHVDPNLYEHSSKRDICHEEFKDKSDYEQMRARADQFAQGDINNAIKYGLSNYADKYGLTPEDVSLWDKVYTDGTVELSDIQKDPIKLRQWNKVLSATRQIQQDLLGDYYGIPKSKYWTIRQSTPLYNYRIKAKKGAKLNLRKVREAAKGEKLAVAQLKAQTADADRFYKTTKDHIDRMYDAINRLTNYSSTKKKRKKKS